jgi:uncharacterized protein YkwD
VGGGKARGSLAALAVAAALFAWAAPGGAAPASVTSYQRATGIETAVLVEINRTRARAGLPRLRLSKQLGNAAAAHSREMAFGGYFEHASIDGLSFWDRIARFYGAKRTRDWAVGENLLWTTKVEPAGVVAAWLESPSHSANLLTRAWREVGLGAITVPAAPGQFGGLDVTILTVDFGIRR